jgi:hypothetical protein
LAKFLAFGVGVLVFWGVLESVLVGTIETGDFVKVGVKVSGDESNTIGLHDANESSRMNLHNVFTLIFLPKGAA